MIATLQDHAWSAFSQAGEHDELPPAFTALREVPPPMLKDNYELDSECLTGELLHAAAVPGKSVVRCFPRILTPVAVMLLALGRDP